MLLKYKPVPLAAGIIIYAVLSQLAWAHGMTEAERQAIIEGGNLGYMQIGATHMLTGYDHLLFVFGIIFFLRSLTDIVKYVTAFTLGHSVTLIFATFNAIQFNYFIIDAIVGLSVCYIAFANIDGFRKYLDINPPNMMAMIFGLGLIHGFGLSSRLQELPLSEDSLLLNIISFNVGIELGQIFALLLMILFMDIWRKTRSFGTYSVISNYVLILAGGLLFLMQMHGYAHSGSPEGFDIAATQTMQDMDTVDISNPERVNVAVTQPREGVDIAEIAPAEALVGPEQDEWEDLITVTIPARDGKEYKFFVEEGATFEYAWQTDGVTLYYDFHAEPKGDTTGYFKSFEENVSDQRSGSLTTSFAGTHGWYWRNDTASPVVIDLRARGEYQRLDVKRDVPEDFPTQVPIL